MKVEGIFTFENLRKVGFEILWEMEGISLNGKKEKFFEDISEDIDFEIFKYHVEKIGSSKLLVFLNVKPSTLVKYKEKIFEMITGKMVIELREDGIDTEMLKELVEIRKNYPFLLSLDDFGRNSSNFDRLKLLNPQFLKIKISFFNRKELVHLITLVKSINPKCKLIAEKVETYEDFKIAKALGFDFWQGYLEKNLSEKFHKRGK